MLEHGDFHGQLPTVDVSGEIWNVVETRSLGWAGYRTGRDTIRFMEECLYFTAVKRFGLMPWQKRWILEVFREHAVVLENEHTGERRTEIRRIVNTALVTIPRKNGKTGFIAALACAFLFGPLYERGIEIVCAATKRDQAKIVFNQSKLMMKASPVFIEDGTFEYYANSIFSEIHASTFKPVASREAGLHGENCNVVFIDEIARLPDLKVYDTLREATSTRANSLIVCFSTMDERVDNPMIELMGSVKARRAADIETDGWHVLQCSADLEADPDPLSDFNMLKANISAPYMPTLMQTLQDERNTARVSDQALARWITVRLNVAGPSDTQFVDPMKWKACAHPEGRMHLDGIDVDEPVVIGVDLSRSRDLTAIAMWFPMLKFLDCMAFLPEKLIATYESRHSLPFRQWVEKGHVIATPGPVIDYDVVADFLANIHARFEIARLRYDTWGFENMRAAMNRADVNVPTEDVRMGVYSMHPFMIKFENLVDSGELTHSNSPILNYCIHSTAAEEDKRSLTGVRKPVKAYHNSLIDCSIASMLAVGQSVKGDILTMDQIALPLEGDAA